MPQAHPLVTMRRDVRPWWFASLCWIALAIIALATLAGGITLLIARFRASGPQPVMLPAGALLLLCAAMQARVLGALWRREQRGASQRPAQFPVANVAVARRLNWHWPVRWSAGAFGAYLLTLCLGPAPNLVWAWVALVAAWHTVLLLPLAATPQVLEKWHEWTQRHTPRRSGGLVVASMAMLVCGEMTLRGLQWIRQSSVETVAAPSESAPPDAWADAWQADEADALQLTPFQTGPFRVRLLTPDRSTPTGAAASSSLTRLEQTVPGVQVVLPAEMRGENRSDVPAQADADSAADLALIVVSVCEELTRERHDATDWFDWKQLALLQWCLPPSSLSAKEHAVAEGAVGSPAMPEDSHEAFLATQAPQMLACRCPMNEAMRGRWQRVFADLDRVVARCQARRIPVALVVVPGQFQVNRRLSETLARRLGASTEQYDFELPQRRLTAYAQQLGIAVVDLLPHFRLLQESPFQSNAVVLNDRGRGVVTNAVGGWLQSRYEGQLAVAAQLTSAP